VFHAFRQIGQTQRAATGQAHHRLGPQTTGLRLGRRLLQDFQEQTMDPAQFDGAIFSAGNVL
jgi:hypothetical protein